MKKLEIMIKFNFSMFFQCSLKKISKPVHLVDHFIWAGLLESNAPITAQQNHATLMVARGYLVARFFKRAVAVPLIIVTM